MVLKRPLFTLSDNLNTRLCFQTLKLFDLFKPKPAQPTIDSYGQSSCTEPQEIQSVMEWLFASLIVAGYFGR